MEIEEFYETLLGDGKEGEKGGGEEDRNIVENGKVREERMEHGEVGKE